MKIWMSMIIILVVIASASLFVYATKTKPPHLDTVTDKPSQKPSPSQVPQPSVEGELPPSFSETYLASLSPEERTILNIDRNKQDELSKNHTFIASVAKTADLLDISNCEPKPVVFKLPFHTSFKLRNSDSVAHTIITGIFRETVPPQSEKDVKLPEADPHNTVGALVGYNCDNKPAGFISIVQ